MLILKDGNSVANNFGFGSAMKTLTKGLNCIGAEYTFNENDKFNVIIANDFLNAEKALELKARTGKPLIASIHLSNTRFEKELIEACDGIIAYSNITKDVLEQGHSINVPIEVVQLGIDTDLFTCSLKEREDFVLFVGRTKCASKNFLDILWKALEEEVSLCVIGDLCDTEIPGVNFKYMPQDKLVEWYNRAQLHILPSRYEPFGLVTLEAMACGCPVAVSTKAGVAELLTDDVALLFNPDDDYSLSDLLERATFDSVEISNYARQFDHIAHARSFVSAVRRLTV